MRKIVYAPRALSDLQNIRERISADFGVDVAKKKMRSLTSTIRQLERFSKEGPRLEELLQLPTGYHYLVVRPNDVFYRIEGNAVRIIRILNEKQDFLQILFGISSISGESEKYWDSQELKDRE